MALAESPPGTYSTVSAADGHTCAIRESGEIVCWAGFDPRLTDAPLGTFRLMRVMNREALAFHIEDLLDQGEPLPEGRRWSIDEAIASYNESSLEDVLRSHAEYGDATPTLSTRFEFVEIEVPAPQAG